MKQRLAVLEHDIELLTELGGAMESAGFDVGDVFSIWVLLALHGVRR